MAIKALLESSGNFTVFSAEISSIILSQFNRYANKQKQKARDIWRLMSISSDFICYKTTISDAFAVRLQAGFLSRSQQATAFTENEREGISNHSSVRCRLAQPTSQATVI